MNKKEEKRAVKPKDIHVASRMTLELRCHFSRQEAQTLRSPESLRRPRWIRNR